MIVIVTTISSFLELKRTGRIVILDEVAAKNKKPNVFKRLLAKISGRK
jgi:hypothetical protein